MAGIENQEWGGYGNNLGGSRQDDSDLLEEAQNGIKIAGRNINNLRYADDTTLTAESEEELKSLLMKVKVGLPQHSENEDHASGPITSWEIDGETVETMSDFIFWGSKITADGDCSHEINYSLEGKLWPT